MASSHKSGAWHLLEPWGIWKAILADPEGRRGVEQLRRAGCDREAGSLWVDLSSFPALWIARDEERHPRPSPRPSGKEPRTDLCPGCREGTLRITARLDGGLVDWRLYCCPVCSYRQQAHEFLMQFYATRREVRATRARLDGLVSRAAILLGDAYRLVRMLPVHAAQDRANDGGGFEALFDLFETLREVVEVGGRVAPLLAAAAVASRSETSGKYEDLFRLRDLVRGGCAGRPQDAALTRILGAAFRVVGVKPPVDYKYLKVVLARRRRRDAFRRKRRAASCQGGPVPNGES